MATEIRGVNLHHDAGAVGVAVPDDVWRRRLQLLKSAGVNALRMAHNPSSANLLRLADEMGFLVQAELFDEWVNPKDKRLNQWARHDDEISRGYAHWFQTHAEQGLKRVVKRDRNHVSVFMWSIGSEIEWTYPRYKEATGYFDMNASGNYFYNPPFISAEEIKHWNYTPGEAVIVEVLTNCAAVELFSNGKSLGVQKLADNPDRELKWALTFEPGDLHAKGLDDCYAMDKVATAGQPSQITLQADRDALANDG